MREAFDMMLFVDAVYLLTGVTTAGLLGWCLMAMRRAERARDKTRGK